MRPILKIAAFHLNFTICRPIKNLSYHFRSRRIWNHLSYSTNSFNLITKWHITTCKTPLLHTLMSYYCNFLKNIFVIYFIYHVHNGYFHGFIIILCFIGIKMVIHGNESPGLMQCEDVSECLLLLYFYTFK